MHLEDYRLTVGWRRNICDGQFMVAKRTAPYPHDTQPHQIASPWERSGASRQISFGNRLPANELPGDLRSLLTGLGQTKCGVGGCCKRCVHNFGDVRPQFCFCKTVYPHRVHFGVMDSVSYPSSAHL